MCLCIVRSQENEYDRLIGIGVHLTEVEPNREKVTLLEGLSWNEALDLYVSKNPWHSTGAVKHTLG